jgi:hypothetical protein
MVKTLRLLFSTDASKTATISLSGARDDFISSEVKSLMNSMIASTIVETKAGKVVGRKSAALYKVERIPYELA